MLLFSRIVFMTCARRVVLFAHEKLRMSTHTHFFKRFDLIDDFLRTTRYVNGVWLDIRLHDAFIKTT